GSNLDERAAEIAHHYEEAGEALDAARWHERAARGAGKGDPAEGLLHWEAGRRRAGALAGAPQDVALGVGAGGESVSVSGVLGATQVEADRVFAEGRALAERAGDLRSLAMLIGNYGVIVGTAERADRYVEKSLEALRIAEESGDRDLQCSIATLVLFSHGV